MNNYIKPNTKVIAISTQHMIALSGGGVATGGTTGNEYTDGDITYSKDNGIGEGLPAVNIWEE